MKRYSDLEVASHSVLIEGLPKKMPRRSLEKKLKEVFMKIISDHVPENANPDEHIMNISVISDYGKCL